MAFFLPASMQKKLLRYGLSHFPLVDTDTLDLEQLDIAWGKRSSVELRDVGLRVEKLSHLLHLPKNLQPTKARILLLHLTIPATDLRNSSIIVEVKGIEIEARLSQKEANYDKEQQGRKPKAKRQEDGTQRRATFEDSELDGEDRLPTAHELAESFLNNEPEQERQQLEAALQSHVDDSDSGSEAGSSSWQCRQCGELNSPSLNHGQCMQCGYEQFAEWGLQLPTFIENFFKGIIDRLEMSIVDVTFILDAELPPGDLIEEMRLSEGARASVSFRVGSVDIEGLTSTPESTYTSTDTTAPDAAHAEAARKKRRVRFRDISGDLITDPALFARLDSVPSSHSPLVTTSADSPHDSPMSAFSQSSDHPSPARIQSEKRSDAGSGSTHSNEAFLRTAGDRGDRAPHFQGCPSSIVSDNKIDRCSDVNDDACDDGNGASQHSLLEDSGLFQTFRGSGAGGEDFLFSTRTSAILAEEEQELEEHELYDSPSGSLILNSSLLKTTQSRSKPPSSDRVATNLSATVPLSPVSRHRQELSSKSSRLFNSQPAPSCAPKSMDASPSRMPRADNLAGVPSPSRSDDSGSSAGSSPGSGCDDLSESKMFSHEEAESMYLSAMSETNAKAGSKFDIPGGWYPSSASSDVSSAKELSPEIAAVSDHHSPTAEIDKNETGVETPRPSSPINSSNTHSRSFGIGNERPVLIEKDNTSDASSPFDEPCLSEGIGMSPEASRYSSRVAKRFLFVDQLSVLFPWASIPTVANSAPIEAPDDISFSTFSEFSAHENMPGAFSEPASSRRAVRRTSSPRSRNLRPIQTGKPTSATPSKSENPCHPENLDVEVEVGIVTSQVDISIGRLLFVILQQLLVAWADSSLPKERSVVGKDSGTEGQKSHKVTIQTVSHAFVEQMAFTSVGHGFSPAIHTVPDPLFSIRLDEIAATSHIGASATAATLRVLKFQFGSSDGTILGFQKPKARSAPHQKSDERRSDISVDFSLDLARGPEFTFNMLPLIINLDMHKLDDRLSCFGGLSGILDLSSSIASNSTVLATSPNARAKNVRFDSPTVATTSNPLSPIKVNAKIEAMTFNLYGKACAIALETTTMRMIVRKDRASLMLDHARFTGPFHNDHGSEAPLVVNVEKTKLSFLVKPEEEDLTQLVSLITPSRDKYEDDDDILLDTLLRQRKKGSFLHANISSIMIRVTNMERLQAFHLLSDEISKLSSVAKYLPEDDRPGVLTIASIETITAAAYVNTSMGTLAVDCTQVGVAHVSLPALFALKLGTIEVKRDEHDGIIVGRLLRLQPDDCLPMVMVRMIGDEWEPTIKIKLLNLIVEYHVATVMAAMGLTQIETVEDMVESIASVATIRDDADSDRLAQEDPTNAASSRSTVKSFNIDLLLRDCAIGLNPDERLSKCIFLLTNAHLSANTSVKEEFRVVFDIRKASIALIDDTHNVNVSIETALRSKSSEDASPALNDLHRQGYQSIATISSAETVVRARENVTGNSMLDVSFGIRLFVMESCADSTQTLIALMNGLKPPLSPGSEEYDASRNDVVPIEDMINSFSSAAFSQSEDNAVDDDLGMDDFDQILEDLPSNAEFVGSFYSQGGEFGDMFDDANSRTASVSHASLHSSRASNRSSWSRPTDNVSFLASIEERFDHGDINTQIDPSKDYLTRLNSTAPVRRWVPEKNDFSPIKQGETIDCPVRVHITVGTFIWNLFDGYDWPRTRDAIGEAVNDVQSRVEQRRKARDAMRTDTDDEESEIGDFLFQSIWIAVPPNRDVNDLKRHINRELANRDIDEVTSETATVTTLDGRTSRPAHHRRKSRSLKLERSKRHKISFELREVTADMLVLPPGTEITQSSIMVKVKDLEIFDHLPSSTWRKFLTYMHDAGERQMNKPMIQLEIVSVKPSMERTADLVMKVSVLPLCLHVDQDALDFITRFFEFKDDDSPSDTTPATGPFIQRIEVPAVPMQLHYKPKKIDYASLRSGHTSEFANFVVLDRAEFQLKHLICYGIQAPDRLHTMLKDLWTDDVVNEQLRTVISGVSFVRPLVDVGGGIRDLVVVPMREYKKDGRLVRSVQKGLGAFGRTTTRELARLGAKVAIGTQTVAEGIESLTSSAPANVKRRRSGEDWDSDDFSTSPSNREEARAVSNYADQPLNVMTGLRAAYTSLERDLLTAKNTIIAIGGEVRVSESATGAAGAILRRTPTVLLRPVIGGTKAIGAILEGVGNSLDKDGARKRNDKYKGH